METCVSNDGEKTSTIIMEHKIEVSIKLREAASWFVINLDSWPLYPATSMIQEVVRRFQPLGRIFLFTSWTVSSS
jgi:hypothetical protein